MIRLAFGLVTTFAAMLLLAGAFIEALPQDACGYATATCEEMH